MILGCTSLCYTVHSFTFGYISTSFLIKKRSVDSEKSLKYRRGHIKRTALYVVVLIVSWAPGLTFRIGQQLTNTKNDWLVLAASVGIFGIFCFFTFVIALKYKFLVILYCGCATLPFVLDLDASVLQKRKFLFCNYKNKLILIFVLK